MKALEQELRLELHSLSFQHEGAQGEPAGVFDISLSLERGKSYAIVGGSGSGKSTLLAALRGLNRASVERLVCDDNVVSNGLKVLHQHTTLIPQEPEVFADTVLKNVTMGNEAEPTKIAQAIEMARFNPVLSRLPKGLETNIAEKGISLSGGEKQRLALARGVFFAFDSDSDIILLDESTSSVDLANEEIIYRNLLKHFRSDLVIATVHKFNLLPLFDEIIVMERGRVIERGTLAELSGANGAFAAMWRQYIGATSMLSEVAGS